jgi:general stress protein 26
MPLIRVIIGDAMARQLSKRAQEIIDRILYVTIASVDADGLPWNSPVFSAHDEDLNFYWGSHIDSQHSKNIKATGRAFLVIYDSTVEAGQGEGVYVKARAEEILDSDEIKRAHNLLQDRRPVPYWRLSEVQAPAPVRLFKAIPEKIWMNDDGERDGQYIDVRKEVW